MTALAPSSRIAATFLGGERGPFRVMSSQTLRGAPLPIAARLQVVPGLVDGPACAYALQGVTSSARYVERAEKAQLDPLSPPLGRVEARCAALIPISKSEAWWALPQDERRRIFEGASRHIEDSLSYLPRIARRLYHARDLGGPFDFLTWFEFAPEHSSAFDELLAMLRSRPEWEYVTRETEIRLIIDTAMV